MLKIVTQSHILESQNRFFTNFVRIVSDRQDRYRSALYLSCAAYSAAVSGYYSPWAISES